MISPRSAHSTPNSSVAPIVLKLIDEKNSKKPTHRGANAGDVEISYLNDILRLHISPTQIMVSDIKY